MASLLGRRLITLTGAGGCGKTRLALQTAGQKLSRVPRRGLARRAGGPGRPELVAQAVASALAKRRGGGASTLRRGLAEPRRSCSCWTTASTCSRRAPSWRTTAAAMRRSCAFWPAAGSASAWPASVTYRVAFAVAARELPSATVARGLALRGVAPVRRPRPAAVVPGFVVADEGGSRRWRRSAADLTASRSLIELAAPKCARDVVAGVEASAWTIVFGVLTGGSRVRPPAPPHAAFADRLEPRAAQRCREGQCCAALSVFVGGWTLVIRGAGMTRACDVDSGRRAGPADLAPPTRACSWPRRRATRPASACSKPCATMRQDRLRESGEDAEVRGRHLEHFLDRVERLEEAPSDEERQGLKSPPGTRAREPACRARRVYRCALRRGGGPETRRQAPLVLGHAWRGERGA